MTRASGTGKVLAGLLFVLLWSAAGLAQQVNIDQIFWCAPEANAPPQAGDAGGQNAEECQQARNLILTNCTVCHTFVPIVLQQFDAQGWQGLIDRHRPRVAHLSEEEIQLILAFLREHFSPENPPPELPPELLGNWTSY